MKVTVSFRSSSSFQRQRSCANKVNHYTPSLRQNGAFTTKTGTFRKIHYNPTSSLHGSKRTGILFTHNEHNVTLLPKLRTVGSNSKSQMPVSYSIIFCSKFSTDAQSTPPPVNPTNESKDSTTPSASSTSPQNETETPSDTEGLGDVIELKEIIVEKKVYTAKHVKKIVVKNPIVEMDGDEMARVIWEMIKDQLIYPYLDIPIKYFDLGMPNRDATNDEITKQAADAVLKYSVGTKCATIVPDDERVTEFGLKKKWPNPTVTILNAIDGITFREPIICKNIPRSIQSWKKPIIVAKHSHADFHMAKEMTVSMEGIAELVFHDRDGGEEKKTLKKFRERGAIMGMWTTDESIYAFAHACCELALARRYPLYVSTRADVLQKYDGLFKSIFDEVYYSQFRSTFESNKIWYEHRSISDMMPHVLRSPGGFVWALKNYDADIISSIVSQGFGSDIMMTNETTTADSHVLLTEPVHGTVEKHYREHQFRVETSTNPISLIFCWTRALQQRANLDCNKDLAKFVKVLEKSCLEVIEQGFYTKDIATAIHGEKMERSHWLTTQQMMDKIQSHFGSKWDVPPPDSAFPEGLLKEV